MPEITMREADRMGRTILCGPELDVPASASPSAPVRALQWTGAVLFVISLAMGGRAYFQHFDVVAPAGTSALPAAAIDVLLFSAFALHHSVLARTPLKHWLHARLASVLFLACTWAWQPLPGTWYALTGVWWWVGAGVQAAGVLVTLLAARTLSLKELMGLDPARQARPTATPATLETRGLYRVVRHPIYFGWVLFVAGAPLMTSTRLLFAVVSVLYLVVAIPFEERSLAENFGEQYRAYCRQVRWRMVPGIY
jgi:protein-S-isoprenylcysteine O-methyltransferase Ste14